MNPLQVEEFVMELEAVQRVENFGYTFFFVGDDHRLPFVTIGHADNEFDDVSKLDREGVFRINIGVSRQTYHSLVGNASSEAVDYSALDVFLPHPHYAKQHFVCILNPTGKNVDITQELILEAHSIASTRFQRKSKK
jgi:hypothetical protein